PARRLPPALRRASGTHQERGRAPSCRPCAAGHRRAAGQGTAAVPHVPAEDLSMWLTPWFLLGLAGIALPIWLHRFARQTDQKRPFASLMFLEASTIRRSRRHELRYWLLLALRVLLLLLLALAFAGPLWKSLMPPGAAGATLHVIVMDTSMSMQQTGTWDRARERAAALISSV